jgi:hypothetical protein
MRGDVLGDALGDGLGAAMDGAASPFVGGRFWCLSEEDEAEGLEEPLPQSPAAYRESSPEISSVPSARYVKRMYHRAQQRRAALLLSVLPCRSGASSPDFSPQLRGSSPSEKSLKIPVLEPTVFSLQEFDATEWVKVFRRERCRRFR